jgi:hypothetical protein
VPPSPPDKPYPDGSRRVRHERLTADLLDVPVWLVEEVSGRCLARGRGTLAGDTLRIADDVVSLDVRAADILYCERAIVVDPAGGDPFGRALWEGLEPGAQLTLVWVRDS